MDMHLLHITRDFPPQSKGGISTIVHGLVQSLQAFGFKSTIISCDGWRPIKENENNTTPIEALIVENNNDFVVVRSHSIRQLPLLAEYFNPMIFTHVMLHHEMLLPIEEMYQQIRPLPCIYVVHVNQYKQSQLRKNIKTKSLQYQKQALVCADRIIVPSHAVHKDLQLVISDEIAHKMIVVPFGVNPPQHKRLSSHRPQGKILYVGRFSDIKGFDILPSVINEVFHRLPEATLTCIGGIPDNKKQERRWKKKFLDTLDSRFHGRVEFVSWLPNDMIPYYQYDLLLLPSKYETFGLVPIEAALAHLPIVANKCESVMEHVGKCAHYSNYENVFETTHLIISILTSQQTINDVKTLQHTFSWSSTIQLWVRLIQKMQKNKSHCQ